mmetsp:Transcript_1030/g.3024  ORF Transcript_1030/g.3024 Transcript_1030/m.3024 type:complete len:354 (+) Transcript_1030:130-1191(+)
MPGGHAGSQERVTRPVKRRAPAGSRASSRLGRSRPGLLLSESEEAERVEGVVGHLLGVAVALPVRGVPALEEALEVGEAERPEGAPLALEVGGRGELGEVEGEEVVGVALEVVLVEARAEEVGEISDAGAGADVLKVDGGDGVGREAEVGEFGVAVDERLVSRGGEAGVDVGGEGPEVVGLLELGELVGPRGEVPVAAVLPEGLRGASEEGLVERREPADDGLRVVERRFAEASVEAGGVEVLQNEPGVALVLARRDQPGHAARLLLELRGVPLVEGRLDGVRLDLAPVGDRPIVRGGGDRFHHEAPPVLQADADDLTVPGPQLLDQLLPPHPRPPGDRLLDHLVQGEQHCAL